ncbi:hypothetical protein [Winogradskyella sp.]|uniref:hypothetical protein n=1 Tax=Winogradskyella sp. TaxID=1883156 RepID=UPI003BAA0B39
MRKLAIILFSFFVLSASQEEKLTLFKGLYYGMPIKEAKKEHKNNKDEYINVDLGDGVIWELRRGGLVKQDNKLVVLVMQPKGFTFGMNNEEGEIYLKKTRLFFEEKGYTLISEPEYWDVPLLFSPYNKMGLLLGNEEKGLMIELRPVKITEGSYVVNMGIYNLDDYKKAQEAEKEAKEKTKKKSGF